MKASQSVNTAKINTSQTVNASQKVKMVLKNELEPDGECSQTDGECMSKGKDRLKEGIRAR